MPHGGKAFPTPQRSRNERDDTGTKSNEANKIKVTFAIVEDFYKIDSTASVSLYLFFGWRIIYIFMYYQFYNLQRLIIHGNVSVHTAVYLIFL